MIVNQSRSAAYWKRSGGGAGGNGLGFGSAGVAAGAGGGARRWREAVVLEEGVEAVTGGSSFIMLTGGIEAAEGSL